MHEIKLFQIRLISIELTVEIHSKSYENDLYGLSLMHNKYSNEY